MRIVEDLVRYGEVQRPYLGVELSNNLSGQERAAINPAEQIGVKITAVTPDSPAAVAGLHVGDIVLKYNDVNIEDDSHLVRLVAHDSIGAQPRLTVFRFRETMIIAPKLAAWKSR
ncbi:MAG: PDZ domain-containing protein, partial [Planctomycetaceae bacterium]|nr:PDZ domain-containing protein [Planctomycetaceae bacterium]